MEGAASIPNIVVVLSVAVFAACQSFTNDCIVDRANRSPLVSRFLLLFALLSVIPPLCAITTFFWSFFHAAWWEPILDALFGVIFVGPILGVVTRLLGDVVYIFSFLCLVPLSMLIALWAVGLVG